MFLAVPVRLVGFIGKLEGMAIEEREEKTAQKGRGALRNGRVKIKT